MITLRRVPWLRPLLTLFASGLIVAGLYAVAAADETAESVSTFTPRPYVAIGAGISELTPEDECPCLAVGDSQGTGVHVAIGYDFTRWLSAEVYFADLGEARIDFFDQDVGPVDYQVYGASAIAYVFNTRSGFGFSEANTGLPLREGLSVYARVGLGGVRNVTELDFNRDHPVHVAFGGGVEYGFKNGFALRGELTSYDSDIQYVSASVVKRFGRVRESIPVVPAVAAIVPPPPPKEEKIQPVAKPIAPPVVYFAFDRHDLSPESTAKLDTFIDQIANSTVNIELAGHTDWEGTDAYNYTLSLNRANSVKQYLMSRGISARRLRVEGFGESQPVSSNETSAGRAENRRTEIRFQ